jgi:hypothetical protein
MKALWLFILSLCVAFAQADEYLTSPPPELPVEVRAGFYLLNFTAVNEKDETFLADVYLSFRWHDPRLANVYSQYRVFLDDAAKDKLTTIWDPHIEFINAYEQFFNSRTLIIHPNGEVEYYISVTSHFFSRLDFKRFPFDRQTLTIRIESFTWNQNTVKFIPDSNLDLMYNENNVNLLEERIISVKERVETVIAGPVLDWFDKTHDFSSYAVDIVVERRPSYFLSQVFIPLLLVMGMSCTVFFGFKEPFLDKIMINMTAFLVILASKFTINLNLPEIGYLTIIDKSFLAAYICIGLTIVVDALQQVWMEKHQRRARLLNGYARWSIFLLFLIILFIVFLTS